MLVLLRFLTSDYWVKLFEGNQQSDISDQQAIALFLFPAICSPFSVISRRVFLA